MADFFLNTKSPTVESTLGTRLQNLKNTVVSTETLISFNPNDTTNIIPVSTFGKTLMNSSNSELNTFIKKLIEGDSTAILNDTGNGTFSISIDNTEIAVYDINGLRMLNNKPLKTNYIQNESGSAVNINSNLTILGTSYTNNILPYTGGMPSPKSIGSDVLRYESVFVNNLNTDTITANFINTDIDVRNIVPNTNILYSLGSATNKFLTTYSQKLISNHIYPQDSVATDQPRLSVTSANVNQLSITGSKENNGYMPLTINTTGSGPIAITSGSANHITMSYATRAGITNDLTYFPRQVITNNGIYPATNSTQDIGNDAYRYNSIYLLNAPITGSDLNLKYDIYPSVFGLDFINKLKPVQYKFKVNSSGRIHHGLIAQDVAKVIDATENRSPYALYTYTPEKINKIYEIDEKSGGKIDTGRTETLPATRSLRYEEFISPIIKSIQELNTKLENSLTPSYGTSSYGTPTLNPSSILNSTCNHEDKIQQMNDKIDNEIIKSIQELNGRLDNLENNTVVAGDTFITPIEPVAVNSSLTELMIQRTLDDLVGRVFTLENAKPVGKEEEEESESEFSMINSLQSRIHTLEQQNQKFEAKLKKLTTALNKLIKA